MGSAVTTSASIFSVRLTTKTGTPRHAMVIISPGCNLLMSAVTGAPAALAFAEGANESINGTRVTTPPMPPVIDVAISHLRRLLSTPFCCSSFTSHSMRSSAHMRLIAVSSTGSGMSPKCLRDGGALELFVWDAQEHMRCVYEACASDWQRRRSVAKVERSQIVLESASPLHAERRGCSVTWGFEFQIASNVQFDGIVSPSRPIIISHFRATAIQSCRRANGLAARRRSLPCSTRLGKLAVRRARALGYRRCVPRRTSQSPGGLPFAVDLNPPGRS